MAGKNEPSVKVTGDRVQLDPATINLLSKYGVHLDDNKPVLVDQGVKIKENNIVINNNTINNTTINITPPPDIPQGRPLQFKPVENTGIENTKTWVDSIYKRQEKESHDRYEDYKNRDWSLTRSANRILRKLDSIISDIKLKLDPRRIGADVNSQLKMLAFIFGFHMLSEWWAELLEIVAAVEDAIKSILVWCGIGDGSQGTSGLTKLLVKVMGGDPEKEDAWTALKELFIGDEGIITLLKEELKLFFKERVECIKLIQFPKLPENAGIFDILKGFGVYLKNILGALIGGVEFTEDTLSSGIRKDAAVVATEGKGWKNRSVSFKSESSNVFSSVTGSELKDTSWGDLALEAHDSKKGIEKQNTLDTWEIDDEGKLNNNTTAGIKQSRALQGMLTDYGSGVINSSAILSGFQNLIDRSYIDNGVLVDNDFIKNICKIFDLPEIQLPEDSIKNYKYVQIPKGSEEYDREGANYGADIFKTYISRAAVESVKKTAGADGFAGDVVDASVTGSVVQDPKKAALWQGLKSGARYVVADKYTLKLVPEDDPRTAVRYGGQTIFKYTLLKKKTLHELEKAIGVKLGLDSFKFNAASKESAEAITAAMIPKIKAGMLAKEKEIRQRIKDNPMSSQYIAQYELTPLLKNLHSLKPDYEVRGYSEIYDKLGALEAGIQARREELDEEWKNSRAAKAVNNVSEMLTHAFEYASDMFGSSDYSGNDFLAALVGTDNYKVTSGFGADRSWNRSAATIARAIREGNPWLLRHQGVDLRARIGTSIYAPLSGTVTAINPGSDGTGGRSLQIVSDNGLFKYYVCHLSALGVTKGQHVEAGQLIAKSGASGGGSERKYSPHIHVQIGYTNTSVSPQTNGWVNPAKFHPEGVVYGKFEKTKTEAEVASSAAVVPPLLSKEGLEPGKTQSAGQRDLARDIVNKAGFDADMATILNFQARTTSRDIPDFSTTNDEVNITQAKLAIWADKSPLLVWNPGNLPSIVQPKIDEKKDFIKSDFFPKFIEDYNTGEKELKTSFVNLGELIIKQRDTKAQLLLARANVVDAVNTISINNGAKQGFDPTKPFWKQLDVFKPDPNNPLMKNLEGIIGNDNLGDGEYHGPYSNEYYQQKQQSKEESV